MKLDFLAIGPQRTGTSWLDAVLRTHPQVRLPTRVKETMFFDARFHLGWPWYESHFDPATELTKVTGEAAPTCFDSAEAVERVRSILPQGPIIVTLRDPVARSRSSLRHHFSKGRISASFPRATRQNPAIVDASRYGKHLARWRAAFGDEAIHVFFQEDLKSDAEATWLRIQSILGLDRIPLPDLGRERVGPATAPRSRLLARVLAEGARTLRRFRLHRTVELGKRLGLRRGFEGGELPDLTEGEERQLRSELAADVAYVEAWTKRPLRDQLWGSYPVD